MNCWVVSPNVRNDKQQEDWKKCIAEQHCAFMGWQDTDKLGKKFAEEVQVGDLILIAQGANRNKISYLCGIVNSSAKWEHVDNTPGIAQNRSLINVLSKEDLDKLELDFRESAFGNADRIPAIYKLYPHTNNSDKQIISTLKSAINNKLQSLYMNEIIDLLCYKSQIILQGPPGTGKTYTAKDIAYNLIFGQNVSNDPNERKEQIKQLEESDQYKLIQFHPAYSYEDFVRGISAKTNGDKIEYVAENRVLGEFAEDARKTFADKKNEDTDIDFKKNFEGFKAEVKKSKQYKLSRDRYIYNVDEGAFADPWDGMFDIGCSEEDIEWSLMFSDLEAFFKNECDGKNRLVRNSFFAKMVNDKFKEYLIANIPPVKTEKFVLVIDEINRANLPAVLGELIYALEYRGEGVDSMYEVEGSRKMIIPPNLYIIGTMNTADRSVGHIDYAIRRRFAFKDIKPDKDVVEEFGCENAVSLFQEISKLFVDDKGQRSEYLSPEFRPESVQLGHSYFLENDVEKLKLKLEYEIKPILMEYLKDGVLLNHAESIIKDLTWQN